VLYTLVKEAERGGVSAADGLDRIRMIRSMRPRHGRPVTVLAYALMTVAICLILQPTALDVAIAAALGGLVGALVRLAEGRPGLSVLIPIGCAMVVSALSFAAIRHGLADPSLRTLIISRLPSGPPAQVTFLPAFWLLVPGAIGLIGVTEAVGDPASAGLQDLLQPLASIMAIALGVLCGVSLYRGLVGTRRRGWRPPNAG
jgi:uncharacterized membrane protein YjjP (DUF1212 family)